jgi:TonB family protein
MLEQVEYPSLAIENAIQGTVAVSFTIGSDGKIANFKVLVAPDRLVMEPVERCIRQTEGMWTPGTVGGVPTPVEVIFGIDFILDYVDPPTMEIERIYPPD